MWCLSHSCTHLIKEEYEINSKGDEQSQHSHVIIIPCKVILQDENPQEEMISEHVHLFCNPLEAELDSYQQALVVGASELRLLLLRLRCLLATALGSPVWLRRNRPTFPLSVIPSANAAQGFTILDIKKTDFRSLS